MWEKGTGQMLDMWVLNMDAASYVLKTPDKILLTSERGRGGEGGGGVIT